MKRKLFCLFLAICISHSAFSQKIDNTASFRNINNDGYFRFNYDNDLFANQDHDYTQGFSFELVSKSLEKNPLNNLLVTPNSSSIKYGLALEHNVFTPTNISDTTINYSDRPFTAGIMLRSFAISTNLDTKSRLNSSFSIGVMGPLAFGKQMQTAIHKAIDGVAPNGWRNQLKNDVIVNYELSYEKQLFRYRNLFAIQPRISVRAGTLYTGADLALPITLGIINSPFSGDDENKFLVYLYSQPSVSVIGYDATFQGGVFSRDNLVTVPTSQMERITAQYQYGLIIQTGALYLEYGYTLQTRQISTGAPAKFGGFKLGFKF